MNGGGKRYIAFILIIILLINYTPIWLIEARADGNENYRYIVQLTDGDDAGVSSASIIVSEDSIVNLKTDVSSNDLVGNSTVSINAASNLYEINISGNNMVDYKGSKKFETISDNTYRTQVDLSDYVLRKVEITISGNGIEKENPNDFRICATSQNGEAVFFQHSNDWTYTANLINGTYQLSVEKEGYFHTTEVIAVSKEKTVFFCEVIPKVDVFIEKSGEGNGKIIVQSNGDEIEPQDDHYTCYGGKPLKITVKPDKYYYFDNSKSTGNWNDEGNGKYVFETQSLTSNTSFEVYFEPVKSVTVSYNGTDMYISRQMFGGKVLKGVSENTIIIKPWKNKKYYAELGGVELELLNGANNIYAVSEGKTTITFKTDEEPPEISFGTLKEPEFIKMDENEYNWYIKRDTTFYVNLKDVQSGVNALQGSKVGGIGEIGFEESAINNKLKDYSLSSLKRIVNDVSTYAKTILTAKDNVGNSRSVSVNMFYDDQPPQVKKVIIDEENLLEFNQNGVGCYKIREDSKTIKVEVTVSENTSLYNLYYLISDDGTLNADQVISHSNKVCENIAYDQSFNDKYEKELNLQTFGLFDGTGFKSGRYYVYCVAVDRAGNTQEEKPAITQFIIDTQLPVTAPIQSVDGQNKRNYNAQEDLSFKTAISDEHTPGGLQYTYEVLFANNCIKEGNKETLMDGCAAELEKMEDSDRNWIKVGKNSGNELSYNITVNLQPDEIDKSGTYILCVKAKDGAGNVGTWQYYKFHYDKTAPTLRNFQFEVTPENTDKQFSFGRFFRKNTVDNIQQKVVIKVHAGDEEKGNFTDDYVPAIKSIRLYYVADKDFDSFNGENLNINSLPPFTHEEEPAGAEISLNETVYMFQFHMAQDSKFYRLVIVAEDLVGNKSYIVPSYIGDKDIMVDGTAPKLTFELTDAYKTPDYTEYAGKSTKNWYKKSRKLTYQIKAGDGGSGVNNIVIKGNGETILEKLYQPLDSSEIDYDEEESLVLNFSKKKRVFEIAKDGKLSIKATLQDNAGNLTTKQSHVYIDEDVPVITQIRFANGDTDDLDVLPMQYGFFFKKKTTVQIMATDYIGQSDAIASGVDTFDYYLQSEDGKIEAEGTLQATKNKKGVYIASLTIPASFKGQMYVKATDHVGQSSGYYRPKGTAIESAAEHREHSYTKIDMPTTSYEDANGNPLYNYNPTIRLKTKDTISGIARVRWSLKAAHQSEPEGKGTLMVAAQYEQEKDSFTSVLSGDTDWSIPGSLDLNLVTKANKSIEAAQDQNSYQISLKLTDHAGNSEGTVKKEFSVDTTAPAVEVEYDNNESYNEIYYNKPRTATITVKDANFSEKGCELTLTGDGASQSEWVHLAGEGCDGKVHGSDCSYTCNVVFDMDGEYTLGFSCTDLAGWTGSYGQTDHFIIDLTDPTIEVTYDNNDAKNGRYYNRARTATIRVEEHNFESEDLKITMTAQDDGAPIAMPAITGWTTNEDVHTATVHYDTDGEYSLEIEYTDPANNAAEPYKGEQFTVDMTEPELVIEGIEDHSANKGEIKPVIRCEDTNLEDIHLDYAGANQGSVKPEYTMTRTRKTVVYQMADVEHIREKDDIYTLHVAALDLAGNEVEQEIRYSVNRFGSVYQIDDRTESMLDQYYVSTCEDMVITETNVDTLKESRLTYSKDGEIVTLTKDTDYRVTQKGDEDSWKQYQYTIYKDNFTEEGKYILSLYSEDAAQNQSDNRVKGKEIEFIMDKTAPSVVVSGIEDRGQYEEDSREISLNVEDNIGTRELAVLCDNQEIASFGQEEIETRNGSLKVTLQGNDKWQQMAIKAVDMAGNTMQTDSITFLITTNRWIQWVNNKPLLYGSIGAAALLIAGAGGVVVWMRRRRKKA